MSGLSRATEAFARTFRPGQKEIYLPNFSVILKRTPKLSPSYASFIVPLWFSKIDLRDYLWNAYGVGTRHIQSYVRNGSIIEGSVNRAKPAPKRWHRKQATKHMTAELISPFKWPERAVEAAGDLWTDFQRKDAEEDQKNHTSASEQGPGGREANNQRRESFRDQARELLEGKRKWQSGNGLGL